MTDTDPRLRQVTAETRPKVASRWRGLKDGVDLRNTLGWIGAYLLVCLIAGSVAGTVWFWVVDLPGYTLDDDFYAHMDEQGHAMVFSADAWLCALGLVAGALLGWLAWRWFGGLGWPCALVAATAGLVGGLVTELVGHVLGPDAFDQRLATAQPSATDLIAVPLTSHTRVYLAVWVAAALLPVLVASLLAIQKEGIARWTRLDRTKEATPT
jgi:hypothetical protein